MRIDAEVYGSEKFSVLEGIIYYLSKEFDEIRFLSMEDFESLKSSIDEDDIKIFIEPRYIIQLVSSDKKLKYVLQVIGEDLDLPITYKIIKKIKIIKEGRE